MNLLDLLMENDFTGIPADDSTSNITNMYEKVAAESNPDYAPMLASINRHIDNDNNRKQAIIAMLNSIRQRNNELIDAETKFNRDINLEKIKTLFKLQQKESEIELAKKYGIDPQKYLLKGKNYEAESNLAILKNLLKLKEIEAKGESNINVDTTKTDNAIRKSEVTTGHKKDLNTHQTDNKINYENTSYENDKNLEQQKHENKMEYENLDTSNALKVDNQKTSNKILVDDNKVRGQDWLDKNKNNRIRETYKQKHDLDVNKDNVYTTNDINLEKVKSELTQSDKTHQTDEDIRKDDAYYLNDSNLQNQKTTDKLITNQDDFLYKTKYLGLKNLFDTKLENLKQQGQDKKNKIMLDIEDKRLQGKGIELETSKQKGKNQNKSKNKEKSNNNNKGKSDFNLSITTSDDKDDTPTKSEKKKKFFGLFGSNYINLPTEDDLIREIFKDKEPIDIA